jgi:molecular chaperone GrpE
VTESNPHEPITVTDKRRIDPETGEIRETAAAPAPSGPASHHAGAEIEALDKETADKVTELTADLQRVQADFANYRKRALRDQQLVAERAKATAVTQLLPVLDDLDAARRHGDLESGPLKSVADKLVTALEGLGLSGFGDQGEEFDPALHEAVQHEGDGTHPIVGSVMRRGYKVGDQVVRHALVGVVDTVPDDETPDNADVVSEQAAESSEQDN